MDGIAARAGVGKATFYRRWSGKAQVVVEAMAYRRVHRPAEIDTGNLRDDIRAAVHDLIELARSEGAAMMGVGGATLEDNPELAHAVQQQIIPVERARFERILERARGRGEASGEVPDLVLEIPSAMVFRRILHSGDPVDAFLVDALVDDIPLPLLAEPASRAARAGRLDEGLGRLSGPSE